MGAELTRIEVDEVMKPLTQYLALGEDAGLVDQLITKSRQPAIMHYTPKDAAQRFASRESFQTWQAKGREIHWLLGTDDDLAGVMWYGPEKFPVGGLDLPESPVETCAIRIYDGYAGHGLARPFMKLSLKAHVNQLRKRGQPVGGLWLQTDADNPAALAVYGKFGYHEVAREAKRITLVLTSDEVSAIVKE